MEMRKRAKNRLVLQNVAISSSLIGLLNGNQIIVEVLMWRQMRLLTIITVESWVVVMVEETLLSVLGEPTTKLIQLVTTEL